MSNAFKIYKAPPTETALGLYNVNLPAAVTGALTSDTKANDLKVLTVYLDCYSVTRETIYQMQTNNFSYQ